MILLDSDAPQSWEVLSPDQDYLISQAPPFHVPSDRQFSILSSGPIIPMSDFNSDNLLITDQPLLPPPAPPLPLPQPASGPPPLCRSEHLAAQRVSHTTTLLAEFSKVSHSHDLVPLSVSDWSLPVSQVLSAIADESLEPVPEMG